MTSLLTKIDQRKAQLDAHRPLSPALVERLRDDLNLRWTYHSNAIEGNTLTLMETKVVLEGVTIGGKTVQEHLEALNHREAIFLLDELVRENTPLREGDLKQIHALILKGIHDDYAGRYRDVNVRITGARHEPPPLLKVTEQMAAFVQWCQNEAADLHPVIRSAKVHADFVAIHPFIDGNGRTSRLLMNLELMKSGYPPAILPVERRLEYYQLPDQYSVDDSCAPFETFIAELVLDSFTPYFEALGIEAW